MVKFISFFLASILLTACVATGVHYSQLEALPDDLSGLYLLRETKYVGALVCHKFWIDDKKVGCLKNGGYIRVPLNAGPHTIKFPPPSGRIRNLIEIDIMIENNKNYYYEYNVGFNGFCGTAPNMVCMSFSNGLIRWGKLEGTRILGGLRSN